MRKMNLAEGVLVLLGFILIICGVVAKISGMNILAPLVNSVTGCFIAACTCFLVVIILSEFGEEQQ